MIEHIFEFYENEPGTAIALLVLFIFALLMIVGACIHLVQSVKKDAREAGAESSWAHLKQEFRGWPILSGVSITALCIYGRILDMSPYVIIWCVALVLLYEFSKQRHKSN